MSSWRVVESLLTLREQVNAAWPGRSKASDGTIGDIFHSAGSDHFPHVYPALGSVPVVCALDITHDPGAGVDCGRITEAIRLSRDARVKYVIYNRRLFSSYPASGVPPYTWRVYTGTDDPHTSHMHVSTVSTVDADNPRPWDIGLPGGTMTDALSDPNTLQAYCRIDSSVGLRDKTTAPPGYTLPVSDEDNLLSQAIKRIDERVAEMRGMNVRLDPEDVDAIVTAVETKLGDAILAAMLKVRLNVSTVE